MMGTIKPEHIHGIIINPFYAITVEDRLVEEHVPQMHDEAKKTEEIEMKKLISLLCYF